MEIRMEEKASHILINFTRDHCPKCQYLIVMTDFEVQFYIADPNTPRISDLKGHSISYNEQLRKLRASDILWVGK